MRTIKGGFIPLRILQNRLYNFSLQQIPIMFDEPKIKDVWSQDDVASFLISSSNYHIYASSCVEKKITFHGIVARFFIAQMFDRYSEFCVCVTWILPFGKENLPSKSKPYIIQQNIINIRLFSFLSLKHLLSTPPVQIHLEI